MFEMNVVVLWDDRCFLVCLENCGFCIFIERMKVICFQMFLGVSLMLCGNRLWNLQNLCMVLSRFWCRLFIWVLFWVVGIRLMQFFCIDLLFLGSYSRVQFIVFLEFLRLLQKGLLGRCGSLVIVLVRQECRLFLKCYLMCLLVFLFLNIMFSFGYSIVLVLSICLRWLIENFVELKYFGFGQKCMLVLVLCLLIVLMIFRLLFLKLLVKVIWYLLVLCLMCILIWVESVFIIEMLILCKLLENWQFLFENLLLVCSLVRISLMFGMFFFGWMFIGMLWLLLMIFSELFWCRIICMFFVWLVRVLLMLLLMIFWVRWLGWVVLVYIFGCLCIGLRLERILMVFVL